MFIRDATAADREILFDIWRRSVRATHDFVSPEDLASLEPLVRQYLASDGEFWVLCSDGAEPVGFAGMSDNAIDALFLVPEFHRRGGGRLLVDHAKQRWDQLTVDVNEQNESARLFYERCGFVVEGRSELDSMGKPYPLLHMRFPAPPVENE